MFVDLTDSISVPVGIFPQLAVAFDDLQRPGGADGDTALAVDALALVGQHHMVGLIVAVYLVGALLLTDAAPGTAAVVSDYLVLRVEIIDFHQYAPSFTRTITGSPPMGE